MTKKKGDLFLFFVFFYQGPATIRSRELFFCFFIPSSYKLFVNCFYLFHLIFK